MTRQEYSNVLQTLAQDDWSAGILIKAQAVAENDLAVLIRPKRGVQFALHTWTEFNCWHDEQRILKESLRPVKEHVAR